jgi:septum formation protein
LSFIATSEDRLALILASASPRRRELLSRITSDFIVVPSGVDELGRGPNGEHVVETATEKARAVEGRCEGVVVAADTVILVDGQVLGKPASREDARRILTLLSEREHEVVTGMCVRVTATGEERTACERTIVHFRALDLAEIEVYLDSEEYRDKAGAYAIQGRAAAFVDRICGDYYNVMGLPICRLVLLLREAGVHV